MKRCPACKGLYRGDPERCPLDGATLEPCDEPAPPRRLGGWVLEQRLAEGNLAQVYRATRKGAVGALKLYDADAPVLRSRREGQAQDRVHHDNVALLLDHGLTETGQWYVVTELIPGESLRRRLDAAPQGFPWPVALHLTAQLGAGLAAIHDCGLIHRDLKPQNVILSPDDDGAPRATILDLGHALVLDQHRLTRSGMVIGSAAYMSPEQAAGREVDARSDLYALGVLLYEMLSGRCPFVAGSEVEVMHLHWNQEPEPPASLTPLPELVNDLCLWLLAKSPDARPSCARVALAAVQGVIQRTGDPVPSEQPSTDALAYQRSAS